jgi:dephospho-CoA kinase
MIIIGITGGTGAGKTTLLQVLEARGALVLDCDAVYHELLTSDQEMIREISSRFPGVVSGGTVDRRALGRIVFADAAGLEKLNQITHRFVTAEVRRRMEAYHGDLVAIDAIGLFESDLARLCDVTIAVTAPPDIRVQRIMTREGLTREYATLRMRAQKSDAYFEERCDYTIINDCETVDAFKARCNIRIDQILGGLKMTDKETLLYKSKNAFDRMTKEERTESNAYCADYKAFLDSAKTEREAVKTAIALAERRGFQAYERGMTLTPGLKIYKSIRGKALLLAVIGKKSLADGANIAAAHVDAPRLDLKQIPLYEDSEMAFFKTHYYGGIKKYQWVTIPLALHGVVAKTDGTLVDIKIGEDDTDPVFVITDLLPHLAGDQMKKTGSELIAGESLNLIIGSTPAGEEKDSDRFKTAVLEILNEKYGITEEDFLSAELEAVPAAKAKDIGLDRSLIGAYGHDDRSCAYAELRAIFDTENPEKTAVCVLADKEEIGSEGVSGMQSEAFECFMDDLCAGQGVKLRHCFERSFCISADVCNAFDPNFPEVSEKRNNAKINYGMGILKFTGARGKSSSNDASAEIIAKLRRIFDENGVIWQMGELGKVDQGGGGTVAMYMAKRNIDTIDAGVPVLSMHAPYETVAKVDCYMTYKGVKAIYNEK